MPPKPSLLSLLKPYKLLIGVLMLLAALANGLGLIIPKLISKNIDAFTVTGTIVFKTLILEFVVVSFVIFVLTYLQGIAQTYASEKVARDLRNKMAEKISELSFEQLEKEKSTKLLTYLTSDIDHIKMFVSMAIVTVVSSIVVILGATILLLTINWKLALAVLAILPLIGILFFFVFKNLGPLFKKTQEIIDHLNLIISESIIGAALVRVFNSGKEESQKFVMVNTQSKETGFKILKYFAIIIPTVGIIANIASLIILALGGYFVIGGSMTLGDFTAFQSYVFILIFPIIMLGFISSTISQAQSSYARISELLNAPPEKESGSFEKVLKGDIEMKNVSLNYGEKVALHDVSFSIKAGTRTAIIGPTAAGKTQLLYVLMGLMKPTSGEILYDGKPLVDYSKKSLHSQVGLVFQDSVMFNLTIRENIAFSQEVTDADLKKAIDTAELGDLIAALPKGLDSIASERGTNLSGGQKQRIMLARALAINPRILLLDDFTARVDSATEKKILDNVEKNYPGITVISVTQKVVSVENYEKIILLMEGEVLAQGTHKELVDTSPEYAQIIESQKSTQVLETESKPK